MKSEAKDIKQAKIDILDAIINKCNIDDQRSLFLNALDELMLKEEIPNSITNKAISEFLERHDSWFRGKKPT